MKRLFLFLLCMCVCSSIAVFAGRGDHYVNLRVFATDVTLQKMVKGRGNYVHFTVWDSVANTSPVYATVYYRNGDTMQYYLIGQTLSPVVYSFRTRAKFDSVHVVRGDTTTAVNGFISLVE